MTPIQEIDPTLPKSVVTVVNRAIEFNPNSRYQSPAEMVAELKVATAKLSDPDAAGDAGRGKAGAAGGPQRSLMVVESKQQLQNLFRERLKSVGYRVLVTADPERALTRLTENPKTADCVLFSTSDLGEAALTAFNRLGEEGATKRVPGGAAVGRAPSSAQGEGQGGPAPGDDERADQAARIARRADQAVGRDGPAIVRRPAARLRRGVGRTRRVRGGPALLGGCGAEGDSPIFAARTAQKLGQSPRLLLGPLELGGQSGELPARSASPISAYMFDRLP